MADAETPDLLCEQARDHIKDGRIDDALACYEKAVSLNNRHLAAHDGLAKLLFKKQEYKRAAELFQRAYQLDPRRVEPLVNLGAVHNRAGNYAEAVRWLRKALTLDRRCAPAYYNLGIAYRGQNHDKMAISAYKEAVRFAPDMVDAHYNLGNALLDAGNAAQAIAQFERALEIAPDFEKARVGLQRAQNAREQARHAISPFGRLVDVNEINKKESPTNKLRELSPQERFDDRSEVHRLAKEAEQLAAAWLHQVRNELETALLDLSRAVTDAEDPRGWGKALEEFESAIDRYEKFFRMLSAKTGELRAHEEAVRSGAAKSSAEATRE